MVQQTGSSACMLCTACQTAACQHLHIVWFVDIALLGSLGKRMAYGVYLDKQLKAANAGRGRLIHFTQGIGFCGVLDCLICLGVTFDWTIRGTVTN